MFDVGKKEPVFSNFTDDREINIGLLDNSIIPMFTGASLPSYDYIEVPNEHGTTVIINNYTTESNDDGHTVIIEAEKENNLL